MNIEHNAWRVIWSDEDQEYLGLCTTFPSLSWLAATPAAALAGIRAVVAEVMLDMQTSVQRPQQPGVLPLTRSIP